MTNRSFLHCFGTELWAQSLGYESEASAEFISSAPTSLSALGMSYDGARAAVVRFSGIEQEPWPVSPPLSERCLFALERARELAHRHGRTRADAEDVLGAVLDDETFGVASDRFLWELGKDAEGVNALRHDNGS